MKIGNSWNETRVSIMFTSNFSFRERASFLLVQPRPSRDDRRPGTISACEIAFKVLAPVLDSLPGEKLSVFRVPKCIKIGGVSRINTG